MTCFQLRSTSIAARGWKRPSRATIDSKSSRPSVWIPCQPGSPMIEARGMTRTSSSAVIRAARRAAIGAPTRGELAARVGRRRAPAARSSRRAPRASPEARARIAGPFVARMPAPISGSPFASRVMSDQPVAASDRARGQSRPCAPATDSTSAAATTRGRWLIAATAASCSSAPRRTGRAPVARASASTRSTSAGRASRAGHDDPRPIDEEIGGGRGGAGRLAPGHRVAADEGQPAAGRRVDDPALRAPDVGDGRAGLRSRPERLGLLVERRDDREWRPGEDDELGAVERGRGAWRCLVEEPAPDALGRSDARRRPRHDPAAPAAGRSDRRGDRAADQPEPEERDPRRAGGRQRRRGRRRRGAATAPPPSRQAPPSGLSSSRRRGPCRRSATRRSTPPGGPGSFERVLTALGLAPVLAAALGVERSRRSGGSAAPPGAARRVTPWCTRRGRRCGRRGSARVEDRLRLGASIVAPRAASRGRNQAPSGASWSAS